MKELFLNFQDQDGKDVRATMNTEKFVVGRHSESDLCIPDSRLSRKHIKIERFADVFVVSDAGSSNGSKLNDRPLNDPEALKNGDVIEIGGLKVVVEIKSDEPEPEAAPPEPESSGPGMLSAGESGSVAPGAEKSSSSMILLLMIPVFGLIFLLFGGVIIYLLVSGPTTTVAKKQDETVYSDDDTGEKDPDEKGTTKTEGGNSGTSTTTAPSGTNTSTNSGVTDPSGSTNSVPTGNLSETAKIEKNGGTFLRNIAQNDPRAFLRTTEQAQKLNSKIKQLSSSSALADNLSSVRKNSSQIKSLAQSKNLKPQFLAIAAVSKLGGSRGDVLQTAQGMTDILDKLGTQIGNELADDSLLVIAAYGQGSSGDFMKMRNMLQDLANKSPESTRAIRTIWFLQKNGKITQTEFENALNFLATGIIAQNPKEFGVNTEAAIIVDLNAKRTF